MTVSALISDDDRLPREKLRAFLADVPWIRCVGEAGDGPATVEMVNRLRPDLLFPDVRMPGLSGLQLLERLKHRPHIVFTTAHAEYAVTAFEVRALDYLLKPFGRKRFLDAIARVRETLHAASHSVERGREALAERKPLSRIFVRSRGRINPIPIERVVRFEAQDDYVAIHTDSGRHMASLRIGELEHLLDPDRFVRIHRSHIVSLDHVKTMTPHASGRLQVLLKDGTRLMASRAGSRSIRRRAV